MSHRRFGRFLQRAADGARSDRKGPQGCHGGHRRCCGYVQIPRRGQLRREHLLPHFPPHAHPHRITRKMLSQPFGCVSSKRRHSDIVIDTLPRVCPVCVYGRQVGKSCLLLRFIDDTFDEDQVSRRIEMHPGVPPQWVLLSKLATM